MNIFASGMCVTNFHRVDNDIVTVALDAAVCGISSPGGGGYYYSLNIFL